MQPGGHTSNVVALRGAGSASEAWERYVELVRQVDEQPGLRTDLNHNIRIIRAWNRFRDLFLAEDEAA